MHIAFSVYLCVLSAILLSRLWPLSLLVLVTIWAGPSRKFVSTLLVFSFLAWIVGSSAPPNTPDPPKAPMYKDLIVQVSDFPRVAWWQNQFVYRVDATPMALVIPTWMPLVPGSKLQVRGMASGGKYGGLVPATLQGIDVLEYGSPFMHYLGKFHHALELRILRLHHSKVAAWTLAILTGNRALFERSTIESFRQAGLSHILALSGLHVGWLVMLGYFALKGLSFGKIRRLQTVVPLILLIFAFIWIGGGSASLWRAGLMFFLYAVARAEHMRVSVLDILATAGFIYLSLRPQALFTPGFLMSYLATLGILLIFPLWETCIRKAPVWLRRSVLDPIGISASAQIGVLPAQIGFFGQLPLLGVFANLIFIPLLLLLLAGIFSGLVLLWTNPSSWLYEAMLYPLITFIERGVHLFTRLPIHSLRIAQRPLGIGIAMLGIMVLTILPKVAFRKTVQRIRQKL